MVFSALSVYLLGTVIKKPSTEVKMDVPILRCLITGDVLMQYFHANKVRSPNTVTVLPYSLNRWLESHRYFVHTKILCIYSHKLCISIS